jgi:hypothetical protein
MLKLIAVVTMIIAIGTVGGIIGAAIFAVSM